MDESTGRKLRELFGPSRETGNQRRLRYEYEETKIMGMFEGGVTQVDVHVMSDYFYRYGFADEEQMMDAARRLVEKGLIEYESRRRVLVRTAR